MFLSLRYSLGVLLASARLCSRGVASVSSSEVCTSSSGIKLYRLELVIGGYNGEICTRSVGVIDDSDCGYVPDCSVLFWSEVWKFPLDAMFV